MRLGTALGALVTTGAVAAGVLAPAQGAAPAVVAGTAAVAAQDSSAGMREPIVIGHRGASAYRPEHTLAAYRLAIAMGADYIEPDLVSTKDRVLVARHENEISGTTDVADRPEFADRKTTKTIDGAPFTGWFTEDFTYKELLTLRAKERLPDIRPENATFDGLYRIPTLQQVIDLAEAESERLGRPIGIYPETKHPSYFDSIGLSLEEPLVWALRRNGLDRPDAHVFVQSFEVSNLLDLHNRLKVKVKLAQLISAEGAPYDFVASGDPRTYADLITRRGLRFIATYAAGIGVNKNLIIPRDESGALLPTTKLVWRAHDVGLDVHTWTFRPENAFLPTDFQKGDDPSAWGNWLAELELLFSTGIDGIFADAPDLAVEVRAGLRSPAGGRAAA
jgi:glycerophosphoryl diester phosphodiesterase